MLSAGRSRMHADPGPPCDPPCSRVCVPNTIIGIHMHTPTRPSLCRLARPGVQGGRAARDAALGYHRDGACACRGPPYAYTGTQAHTRVFVWCGAAGGLAGWLLRGGASLWSPRAPRPARIACSISRAWPRVFDTRVCLTRAYL